MRVIGPYKRFFLRLDDGGRVQWFVSKWCVKVVYPRSMILAPFDDKDAAEGYAATLRRAM